MFVDYRIPPDPCEGGSCAVYIVRYTRLNGFADLGIPLTIFLHLLRLFLQLTVPIPCKGSYCRALVAISSALSPLWLGFYLVNSFDVNVWGWQLFGVHVSLAIVIGLLILRYAPGGDGIISPFIVVRFFVACLLDPNVRSTCPEMSISDPCPLFPWHAQVPIALYGFVIAATWIDFIADHLFALLEFFRHCCQDSQLHHGTHGE